MTTISAADARALLAKQGKRNKFGAKPVVEDGIRFASMAERNRYLELKLLLRQGEISNLELQPEFKLAVDGRPVRFESGRQAKYIADFAYWNGEKRIVEDMKGMPTREYLLKKAVVEAMHPAVKIVEVK